MRLFIQLLGFLVVMLPVQASAQAPQETLVKIRLLPEKSMVEPGDEIWIGIEQSIADHWHTYWKNPGDSGAILRAKWSVPEGFEIGDIQWPTPHKIPYEPLLNYGYEEQVMLLQKLTVPDTIPEGPISLNADIEVLVCKVECIPEYGTYTLTLNADGAMQEDNAAYIAAAFDKLPKPYEGEAFYDVVEGNFVLKFNGGLTADVKDAEFFPDEWGVVDNPAPVQTLLDSDGGLVIKQLYGGRDFADIDNAVSGVLAFEKDGQRSSVSFTAEKAVLGAGALPMVQSAPQDLGIVYALVFALFGGLILNLMPCVFPVLSLKALSLVKVAEKDAGKARVHGVVYTLGVVLSFLVIAGVLMALKSGGSQIGWGFQLQNPFIVGMLAYLLFVIGLNLSGVFEFGNPFGNTGSKLTRGEGLRGSFFTGILATLVATPCTAPFMAGAIGFAMVQPPLIGLSVFAALGFGLALPYLLLSVMPGLQKILPKPGAWMDVFKQLLAFPMFAASVWLVWVIGTQTGVMGMGSLLGGMVFLAFGIWLFRHKPAHKTWRSTVKLFALLSFVLAFLLVPKFSNGGGKFDLSFGEAFSQAKLEEVLDGDAAVFAEMTAAWCITCKVNHAVAIDVPSTRDLFAARGVRYLIGDWTNEDPEITQFLSSYGRNGVPLYVYFGARGSDGQRPQPVILPQVLTPGIVKSYVDGKTP